LEKLGWTMGNPFRTYALAGKFL